MVNSNSFFVVSCSNENEFKYILELLVKTFGSTLSDRTPQFMFKPTYIQLDANRNVISSWSVKPLRSGDVMYVSTKKCIEVVKDIEREYRDWKD